MPIDIAQATSAELPPVRAAWNADQVILYHLGLGAGLNGATDAGELAYLYERGLKVLPTFGGVVSGVALPGMNLNSIPGVDVDFRMLLHGEQETVIHRPLPAEGEVDCQARVAHVWDAGKAAVVVLEVTAADPDGTPWFSTRSSLFVRGEGGFDGERPPPAEPKPDGDPDAVFEIPTLPNQALLYRLSGDKNPLHADPKLAEVAGFDRPILHGMCTYAAVCKAVVDGLLGGDVAAVARYAARFAGVVFPGETIIVSAWDTGSKVLLSADSKDRAAPVLSNAVLERRS